MSSSRYRAALLLSFQLPNAKGRQRIDHATILPCGAAKGDIDARVTLSKRVEKRGHVVTHMSSLSQKCRDNPQRVAGGSHPLFARQQYIRSHQLQKCEADRELGSLGANPVRQLFERLAPSRVTGAVREQNQPLAHEDSFGSKQLPPSKAPIYPVLLNKALIIPL